MNRVALLIVDMQKAYFRNESLERTKRQLIEHINRLIDSTTEHDILTINVVTEHAKDRSTWTLNMLDDDEGYLLSGDEETELVDGLQISNATKLVKTRDSAFFGTDLEALLQEHHIETLVLCGVSTHSCIFQTAADAYAANFRVMLATDAIASHDPDFHDATFKQLAQEYRQSLHTTAEIIASFTHISTSDSQLNLSKAD